MIISTKAYSGEIEFSKNGRNIANFRTIFEKTRIGFLIYVELDEVVKRLHVR